jgi:hypothetical protein
MCEGLTNANEMETIAEALVRIFEANGNVTQLIKWAIGYEVAFAGL